jgi:branched-chain amino acid transport system ATP-binding protein
LLKIKDLNAFYGKSHDLWDINMNAESNKITALVGRNGMGKTTTLKCIMGIIRNKTGSIIIEKEKIENRQPYEIAKLGVSYVPDNLGVFPTLSVEENILIASYLSKRSGVWDLEAVYSLFPKLEILKNSKGGHLSGGEKKMLSIGRALAANPKLILIDEPTEGLAPLIIQTLADALMKIKELGVTILLTDQNINFVKYIADFVYIIEEGKIKHSGTIEEIKNSPEIILKYLTV